MIEVLVRGARGRSERPKEIFRHTTFPLHLHNIEENRKKPEGICQKFSRIHVEMTKDGPNCVLGRNPKTTLESSQMYTHTSFGTVVHSLPWMRNL